MFRLSTRQWLLLAALLVIGGALQVAWVLYRPEPPRPPPRAVPPPERAP